MPACQSSDRSSSGIGKAISIDPQNAPAYRMLGYIQVQQKQMNKGIANLQKASDLGDEVAIGLLEKYKK